MYFPKDNYGRFEKNHKKNYWARNLLISFFVCILYTENDEQFKAMKTLKFSPLLLFFILILPDWGMAQMITVSGYVTHQLDGTALENVTIFDSVSGIGTISDKNGYYQLMLSPGKLNLIFSEHGFGKSTQQFISESDTSLMIKLVPVKNEKSNSKIQIKLQSEEKEKDKRHTQAHHN